MSLCKSLTLKPLKRLSSVLSGFVFVRHAVHRKHCVTNAYLVLSGGWTLLGMEIDLKIYFEIYIISSTLGYCLFQSSIKLSSAIFRIVLAARRHDMRKQNVQTRQRQKQREMQRVLQLEQFSLDTAYWHTVAIEVLWSWGTNVFGSVAAPNFFPGRFRIFTSLGSTERFYTPLHDFTNKPETQGVQTWFWTSRQDKFWEYNLQLFLPQQRNCLERTFCFCKKNTSHGLTMKYYGGFWKKGS